MADLVPENDISYQGPNQQWVPPTGSSVDRRTSPPSEALSLGYHDLPKLKSILEAIVAESTALIQVAEVSMVNYNLLIASDQKLQAAQNAGWPTELGEPKQYISYTQFKALGNIDTRVSSYIRKTYIDKIRGPAGTNVIDIINVANAIQQEALHIKDFIDDAIGTVSDSAEFRAIELLQDWATAALRDTRSFRDFFEARGKGLQQIPQTELAQVTPDQARKYQAIFQVKLNLINKDLETLQTNLTKQTGLLSDIFYKRFFAPALKMKLNVLNDVQGTMSTMTFLGSQAQQASDGLTVDYITALSDQMTRNNMYNSQIADLKDRIAARDTYAGHIQQLAQKGAALASPFIKADTSPQEVTVWNNIISPATPTSEFLSLHSSLGGTDEPLAHPQYLLKAGDSISGNIAVDDGIKIDNIDLDQHSHTGIDGSSRISGEDILFGTLPETSINPTPPSKPASLQLKLFQTKVVPPGVFSVDAVLSWQGDSNNTYEIQIVKE